MRIVGMVAALLLVLGGLVSLGRSIALWARVGQAADPSYAVGFALGRSLGALLIVGLGVWVFRWARRRQD